MSPKSQFLGDQSKKKDYDCILDWIFLLFLKPFANFFPLFCRDRTWKEQRQRTSWHCQKSWQRQRKWPPLSPLCLQDSRLWSWRLPIGILADKIKDTRNKEVNYFFHIPSDNPWQWVARCTTTRIHLNAFPAKLDGFLLGVNDNTLGAQLVSHGPRLDLMPMTTLPGPRSCVSRLGVLHDYVVLVFKLVLWPKSKPGRMWNGKSWLVCELAN